MCLLAVACNPYHMGELLACLCLLYFHQYTCLCLAWYVCGSYAFSGLVAQVLMWTSLCLCHGLTALPLLFAWTIWHGVRDS